MFVLHNRTKTFVTIYLANGKPLTIPAEQTSTEIEDSEMSVSIRMRLNRRPIVLELEQLPEKEKSRTKIEKVVPPVSGGGEGK